MRNLKALITYDGTDGKTIKRENVTVSLCSGMNPPVVWIDLPRQREGEERAICIGLKTLQRALGFKLAGRRKIRRAR